MAHRASQGATSVGSGVQVVRILLVGDRAADRTPTRPLTHSSPHANHSTTGNGGPHWGPAVLPKRSLHATRKSSARDLTIDGHQFLFVPI
jgi:hypothetical protein